MTQNFEVRAGLRARRLTVIVAPEASVEAVGEDVTVASRELRNDLPPETHAGDTYSDVAVEKEVRGNLHDPPSA